MKPGAPVSDPRDSEQAERIAARMLARRGYSRVELRERLARRGVADAVSEALLARFVERGWIDEARLAFDHALAGIARGRGRGRVVRELRARGLGEFAATAWQQALDERGGDAAALLREEVRRRVTRCGGRLAPRDYRRVYTALLRAGHDAEALRAELEPHRYLPDETDEIQTSGEPTAS